MSRVYTLTEESIKLLAADHRKLAAQVENIRRQIQPQEKTPYTMPSEVVQVWHTSGSPSVGDTVSANSDGFHKGRIKRIKGDVFSTSDNCFILFVDTYDTNAGSVSATQGEYYGPARANGFVTSNGETLPLYTVRNGSTTPPEQSRFFYYQYASGIGTTEANSQIGNNSGVIDSTTITGLGTNPSGFTRILRADAAMKLWFNFNCYWSKQTAAAGVATCYIYVKRWNSSDALQQTETGYCDVPTLSAITAGMTLAFQGRMTMAANDYLTCTAQFSGGYSSTMAINNMGMYLRTIRN